MTRFSDYDFFGHLIAGAVVLGSVAYTADGVDGFISDPSASQLVLLAVVAYVIGHVVAAISSPILEHWLTRDQLGTPTDHLLASESQAPRRTLFGSYVKPLDSQIVDRILEKASIEVGITEPGDALFHHCRNVVLRSDYTQGRLQRFLNLYGFSRNTAMAALIGAAAMLIGIAAGTDATQLELLVGAAVSLLIAFVMYQRYLKYYRLYAAEIYITYPEATQ